MIFSITLTKSCGVEKFSNLYLKSVHFLNTRVYVVPFIGCGTVGFAKLIVSFEGTINPRESNNVLSVPLLLYTWAIPSLSKITVEPEPGLWNAKETSKS